MRIFDYSFNVPSLIIGALIASLLWLFLWGLTRLIKHNKSVSKEIKVVVTAHTQTDIREAYMRFQFDLAQKYHLANPLFALEEILIEPRIITPPPIYDPKSNENPLDSSIDILPFLPECGEVISQYLPQSIGMDSLPQIDGNFYFYGNSGIGKSTSLAAICLRMINVIQSDTNQHGKMPLFLHINDIDWRNNPEEEPISLLIEAMQNHFPKSSHSDLKKFFLHTIENNDFVLLLDGMDELSPIELDAAFRILEGILLRFPDLKVISTAFGKSVEYFAKNNFEPLLLATWRIQEIQRFIRLWKTALMEQNDDSLMSQNAADEISLNWTLAEKPLLSPFEWTLRLWAFTCKDNATVNLVDLISEYVRRCGIDPTEKQLHKLSENLLESKSSCIKQWDTDINLIHACTTTSLLKIFSTGYIGYSSPILNGYFSAINQRKSFIDTLSQACEWSSLYENVRFISNPDLENRLISSINFENSSFNIFELPLVHKMFSLNIKNPSAKNLLFKRTYPYLLNKKLAQGVKLQLLSAFLIHEDQDYCLLLRQLLNSESSICRSIAAIAAGGIREEGLIPELESIAASVNDQELLAVLLALSQFEKASTVSILLEILINGSDFEKHAAALALASGSSECHKALKQAVKIDDILVRRAAIHGITMVHEPWVKDFLTQISMDEKQWIVKNEAITALESMESTIGYRRPSYLPAHKTEWLIQYASSKGIGISPSKPPVTLFREILDSGTTEEKIGVLDHLLHNPDRSIVEIIKEIFTDSEDGLLREKAAYCLWQFSKASIT